MSYTLANVGGRAALVADGNYYDLETVSGAALGSDPMAALAALEQLSELSAGLGDTEPTGSLDGADLGSPSPSPRNSYGIGLNYKAHADEASMDLPTSPLVFTKFPSCIVGPNDDIELRSDGVDYEGEIVVVIGEGGKDIDEANAWDHVAGLSAGQDVSDRPLQMASRPPHFALGKSFDTFGPIGPTLVSIDQFEDLDDISISCSINGEVRQQSTTGSLIFSIPQLISYLSRITTLRTGDVIFSGTPEGVGMMQNKLLKDGDVVTTTVDIVGTMTNRCVRVSDHGHPGRELPKKD